MAQQIFNELRYDDEWGWCAKQTLDFGGNIVSVDILIQSEEDEEEGITKRQEQAFSRFIKKWPQLQDKLVNALIEYYNEEERFSYGPEDEEELAEWWPEIETKEALLQAVTLETIVVPPDYMMDEGRYIYLLFTRTWGGEDSDDDGIGVCFINEKIDEIAYKDIAF